MINRKQILYLSYDGLSDPLGQSQILPYLVGLSKKGFSFHILSFEKRKSFYKKRSHIRKELNNFQIFWYPKLYHKKPPILSTLFDLTIMYFEGVKLMNTNDIQLIHARSYLAGLIGAKLKRKFHCKLLFDLRGFWADERVDGGLWSLENPIYRQIYHFFKRKEYQMMKEADHIISLTYSGREELVTGRLFKKSGERILQNKITIIPCSVDLELFNPSKINSENIEHIRNHLDISTDQKIMTYLGSTGTWYLVKEMLLFFKEWNRIFPNYVFLFITKDDPLNLISLVDELNISKEHVLIVDAERHEIPDYLSLSDLGIFFIKSVYSKKASSATKMGEMIAMQLPIITNSGVGDGDYLINKYGFGKIFSVSEPYAIEDEFVVNKDEVNWKVREYFSLETGVERYLSIYRGLFE